jgi:hypothetical protein
MMILLNGHSLQAADRFMPEKLAVNLAERTSTATMTIGPDAPVISVDDWLQDETGPAAGIVWRVKTIDEQYDKRTRTVTMEHAISTLRDRIMFGEVKPTDISGNKNNPTAKQAAQYILSRQSDWTLGDFSYTVSNPYSFNGDDLFSALETVSQLYNASLVLILQNLLLALLDVTLNLSNLLKAILIKRATGATPCLCSKLLLLQLQLRNLLLESSDRLIILRNSSQNLIRAAELHSPRYIHILKCSVEDALRLCQHILFGTYSLTTVARSDNNRLHEFLEVHSLGTTITMLIGNLILVGHLLQVAKILLRAYCLRLERQNESILLWGSDIWRWSIDV